MRLAYELRPSPGGSWLNVPAQERMWRQSFHAVRAETSVWIFRSLWNCWQRALLLCGSYSANLKQTALVLHEPNGHSREILRRVTPPGAGIHFWADNNHVGLFVPSSVTTTEPAWGSGTRPAGETHRHNFHWIELTGLTWDGWTRRKAPIQNRHEVTEIKIFLYLYHNQACLKLQHVVFLPADTQQVFSCYLLSHFVFPSAYCWYFVWLSAYCSILFLKMLFGLNVLLDIEQFIPPAGLTEQ